jgi:heme/copper-type cytochrome/quinol oxidase subunit 3
MGAAVATHGGHAASHIDDDAKVRLGMRFYVLTDIIFVAFLLISYIWLRAYNTGGSWFPKGTKLPDATTSWVLTGLMVASAVAYYLAYQGVRMSNQGLLRGGLAVATLLTIATLIGQLHFMANLPFVTTDGSFASAFILLSGYHVYHLFFGTFLGLGVTHRALRGRYAPDRTLGVVTVGYFWYWMAAFPVLVSLMMLVLPPQL